MKKTTIRSVLKSLTYKSLSTISTFLAAWLITGNLAIGMTLGLFEVTFKLLLYFFHERIWYKVNYGMKYSKHKKDDKVITTTFLKDNGFQTLDDEKSLILPLDLDFDLVATRRRSSHKGKTCYKVRIRGTDLGVCKKRGEVIQLLGSLNR